MSLKRRKVLLSRTINLLDVLTTEAVEALVKKDEPDRRRNRIGFGILQRHNVSDMFASSHLILENVLYHSGSDSLVMDINIHNKDMILKVENFLKSGQIMSNSKSVILKNKASYNRGSLISGFFEENKVLSYYSKTLGEEGQEKAVGWINLQDMSLTEVKGYKEGERCPSINKVVHSRILYVALPERRMLVVNPNSALIYDYHRGKLLDRQIYKFSYLEDDAVQKLGNLIFIGDSERHINILKTEGFGGKRTIKVNTIFLRDLFEGTGLIPANFIFPQVLRLDSGNCLMVLKRVERRDSDGNDCGLEQATVEIDHHSLEVVAVNRADNSGKIDPNLGKSLVYLVSGLLVFIGKQKKTACKQSIKS